MIDLEKNWIIIIVVNVSINNHQQKLWTQVFCWEIWFLHNLQVFFYKTLINNKKIKITNFMWDKPNRHHHNQVSIVINGTRIMCFLIWCVYTYKIEHHFCYSCRRRKVNLILRKHLTNVNWGIFYKMSKLSRIEKQF